MKLAVGDQVLYGKYLGTITEILRDPQFVIVKFSTFSLAVNCNELSRPIFIERH